MDREQLYSEVKQEYARLASDASRQQGVQTLNGESPEMYYERLLQLVLDEISAGTFDSCTSGVEVVETVANHKSDWLSKWTQCGWM